jgi:hypothetical protein
MKNNNQTNPSHHTHYNLPPPPSYLKASVTQHKLKPVAIWHLKELDVEIGK